jgi:glycosyltransferase involved in cell wall biosynthesis
MAVRVVFVRSKSSAGMEPRIAKEAGTLARAGYDVHVVLWDRDLAYPGEETRDGVRIHRFRLRAPEGQPALARLLPRWWLHLFFRILRLRPEVIHAVDFDTVVPAYAAGRLAGARIVYDIFDFYSEMITAPLSPRLRQSLAKWERNMIEQVDIVIVPDLRRRAQFETARPKALVEILNVPEERRVPAKREDPGAFVVFYGGMIAKDRGLKDLLVACEDVGAHLLVAGHGPDEAHLLNDLETSHAAMYLGTIPYEEVLERTASCQVVAALYDPAVPNNRFAAPNKLFEAMMFAKPVLVSQGTLAADIVRDVGCGLIVRYGDREGLKKALESLMLSPTEAATMGARGRAAFERRYNWKAMEPLLLKTYRDLVAKQAVHGTLLRDG